MIDGFSGQALRQARRERDLSQTELSELLGAHRTSIARWEAESHAPTMKQITRLAEILKKDPQWFFVGEDPSLPAAPVGEPTTPELDPWLRQVPWERVQALTAGALRTQGVPVKKMAVMSGLDPDRLLGLIKGEPPSKEEILALRRGLGERFDPTPMLARTLAPPPKIPKRVKQIEGLSDAQKIEFLMQKVNRMELEFFKLKDTVDALVESA